MNSFNFESKTLLNKGNGQIWNFYISNHSIFYNITDENKDFTKKVKLIDDVKSHDITLDSADNIHIACSKNDGSLCYLHHANGDWKKRVFKKSTSKSNIEFINILNIDMSIHIFYAFRTNNTNKPYKIFHMYNLDNEWKYEHLTSNVFAKNTRPYFVDYNKKGHIFFLYKYRNQGKKKIHVRILDPQKNKWTITKDLKFKRDNIDIINLLIDSKDNIHFLYKYKNNLQYTNHPYKDFNRLLKVNVKNKSINLESKENVDYHIFENDNRLWISWNTREFLHYTSSEDYGKVWREKEYLESNETYKVKYVGLEYKGIGITKPLVTFGIDKNSEMYLLGMDRHMLDLENMELDISLEDLNYDSETDNKADEMVSDEQYFSAQNLEEEKITKDFNETDDSHKDMKDEDELQRDFYLENNEPICGDEEIDIVKSEPNIDNASSFEEDGLGENTHLDQYPSAQTPKEKEIPTESSEINDSHEDISDENELQKDFYPENNEPVYDDDINAEVDIKNEKPERQKKLESEIKNPRKKSLFEKLKDFLTRD